MFLTKFKTAALVLAACPAFTGTGFFVNRALAQSPNRRPKRSGTRRTRD